MSHIFELLRLDEDGSDAFISRPAPYEGLRLRYGGELLGQAMGAAMATLTDEREATSMHAAFLRPAQFDQPVRFAVERGREGRMFTSRSVTARQGDAVVLTALVMAKSPTEGHDQLPPPPRSLERPPVPAVPDDGGWVAPYFEVVTGPNDGADGEVTVRWWCRSRHPVTEQPVHPAAVLAYVSDLRAARGAQPIMQHPPLSDHWLTTITLNHTMWFHGPARADGWLLVEMRCAAVRDGIGVAQGTVYGEDGVPLVSTGQQALLQEPQD